MTAWPALEDATRRLVAEASTVAKHLGHSLAPFFVPADASSRAICTGCGESVTVRARSFNRAPISGVVASLRCTRTWAFASAI